jgi:hypothetical protein
MKYTQADIKTQIRAAQASKSGINTFSTEVTEMGNLVKKFEGVINVTLDTKNDIYPYIRIRYEQGEHFKIVFYTFQQLKMLAEDLTNFATDDEYFEIIRKKY